MAQQQKQGTEQQSSDTENGMIHVYEVAASILTSCSVKATENQVAELPKVSQTPFEISVLTNRLSTYQLNLTI